MIFLSMTSYHVGILGVKANGHRITTTFVTQREANIFPESQISHCETG